MRIGHFQCECRVDEFDHNTNQVITGLERAVADRVQVVCFPECCLTGYSDNAGRTRAIALAMDGPEIQNVLEKTRHFDQTIIVGLSEIDRDDLYITSFVARGGKLLGRYRKCSAYESFNQQGREWPVFQHDDLTFGIVICSDGGYIEPSRILALKGARVIFSPHYNYIAPPGLINHFQTVRADHTARAVENNVYFLRGNNVNLSPPKGISIDGIGYGDSYLIEPSGQILTRSRLHREDFIFADIDPSAPDASERNRSLWSATHFGDALRRLIEKQNL